MPARSLLRYGPVLLLVSCAVPPPVGAPAAAKSAIVRGRVLDDEGRPLALASVRRLGRDGRVDAVVPADAEGRFTVPVDPGAGVVKLHVSGLVRKSETVVVTTDALPLEVVVKLGSYDEIPANVEGVEVIFLTDGAAGGIRSPTAVPGGFDFDPHEPDGSYRFLLATADDAEHVLADGMVEVKDGHAHVPYDRAYVPPAGRKGSVALPVGSVSRAVNDVLAVATREVERSAERRPKRAPPFSWSALRDATALVAKTETRPRVRNAALVAHFAGGSFATPTPEDRGLALEAVASVPPSDPLWSIASIPSVVTVASPFENVVNVAGEPLDDAFVRGFVENQADVAVVTRFLHLEMLRARGTPERQRMIVAQSRVQRLRDSAYSRSIAALDPDRPISAGKPAPSFDVPALDGTGRIGTAGLAGKPYLVEVWSTSCGPCIAEQPLLHYLYNEYGKTGRLGMLSIAADDLATVAKFRSDPMHPMPWRHGIVDHAEMFALFAKLGEATPTFPFHLLVDAKGVIVDASPTLRTETLGSVVERMMR